MPTKEIEVIIRGRPGSGAFNAAYAMAMSLEAAGASVDIRSPVAQSELATDALRGVRVTVKVEDSGLGGAAEPPRLASETGAGKRIGFSDLAKMGIGAVLLLMLFGAELRLQFGLRLDTIVTLAGIWAFWHFCLRQRSPTSH
jgi:hypothetical protein